MVKVYIERDPLCKKISELEEFSRNRVAVTHNTSPVYREYFVQLMERQYFKNYITKLPVVEVAAVIHGRWKQSGYSYKRGKIVHDIWKCSRCGNIIDNGIDDPDLLPNYCSDCGALMDGGQSHDN